jgi:hypothetical protein
MCGGRAHLAVFSQCSGGFLPPLSPQKRQGLVPLVAILHQDIKVGAGLLGCLSHIQRMLVVTRRSTHLHTRHRITFFWNPDMSYLTPEPGTIIDLRTRIRDTDIPFLEPNYTIRPNLAPKNPGRGRIDRQTRTHKTPKCHRRGTPPRCVIKI